MMQFWELKHGKKAAKVNLEEVLPKKLFAESNAETFKAEEVIQEQPKDNKEVI